MSTRSDHHAQFTSTFATDGEVRSDASPGADTDADAADVDTHADSAGRAPRRRPPSRPPGGPRAHPGPGRHSGGGRHRRPSRRTTGAGGTAERAASLVGGPPSLGPPPPEVMPREEAIAAARSAVRRNQLERDQERQRERESERARERERALAQRRAWEREQARVSSSREEPPSGDAGEERLPARERMRLALRERVPLWLQLRCGMEPKTLVALGLVLLVAVGFAVHHFWAGRPQSVAAPDRSRPVPGPSGEGAGTGVSGGAPGLASKGGGTPGRRLVIDVSGKVRDPGVHRLPSGARVADALRAAGGLRKGADTGTLNRARLLVDGEQIVVAERGKGGAAVPAPSAGAPATPGGSGSGGGADGAGAAAASGPAVSLNSATPEQLETIPGVGPVLAQHIIEFRTEHGGFSSIDQLREVNGIGEKRFADMKPRVTP